MEECQRRVVALLLAASASVFAGCVTKRLSPPVVRTTRKVAITSAPRPAQPVTLGGYGFVDGQLIVSFKGQAAEKAAELAAGDKQGPVRLGDPTLDRLLNKYHATALQPAPDQNTSALRYYLLLLAPDANVLRAAEEFSASPLVERAEPRYRLQIPPDRD